MPENRSYLVAAGLRQALDYLHGLRFSDRDIGYLRNLPVFAHVPEAFFEYLTTFRFSGDVSAALVEAGVVPKKPTGKKHQAMAQEAIVAWAEESGLSLGAVSLVLAKSTGPIYQR